jgi:hypothetical protein
MPELNRIVVTGWRGWKSLDSVWRCLDHVRATAPLGDVFLGVGDADGADLYAYQWALANAVAFKRFIADWDRFGKAAGPIRNMAMIDEVRPQLVVAFLHPACNGTVKCKKYAEDKGIPVFEVWA